MILVLIIAVYVNFPLPEAINLVLICIGLIKHCNTITVPEREKPSQQTNMVIKAKCVNDATI